MAAAHTNPALAFVDAELAVAAAELREVARLLRTRGQARDAGSGCCARTVNPVQIAQARTVPRKPRRIPSRTTPTVRTRLATMAACLTCGVVIGATALGAVPAAGQRAEATQADAQASASVLRERASRDARASRIYTWPAVPGARRYQVRILREEQSVFEATTRRLAVELPEDLQMQAGRYTWLVTPIFGDGSASARPVVEATFLVEP